MDKDTKKLIKAAKAQGFTVTYSNKGHVIFAKDGRRVAVGAGTTGDHRSRQNLIAQLRRAGFQWPPTR